jgi:uncharacterized protein (TIGR03435 family)
MTGLTGRYDFKLEFRPADARPDSVREQTPQAIDAGGMVMASVEEQLGLKLQAQHVPADILIVEHAEHPSEN